MWHHILVPLDGTPGAELALPLAARIARGLEATLTLVRIQPPLPEPTYLLDAAILIAKIKETEREQTEAKHYLAHIVTTDCLDGVGVRTKLMAGPPVETLLQFSSEQQVDLIVMCRHDHQGFQRWLSGQGTDQMSERLCGPVSGEQAAQCRTIVGQRQSRERAFADNDRVNKFYCDVLSIDGPGSIAKGQKPTALMKAAGHSFTRLCYLWCFNGKKKLLARSYFAQKVFLRCPPHASSGTGRLKESAIGSGA